MTTPPNPILDRPASLGQFAMSVRIDVLDRSLSWQDSLTPLTAGTVTCSTQGAINRSWTGVRFAESVYQTIGSPGGARFRPVIVLEDGSGPPGTTIGGWPLGVFVLVDAPMTRWGEQPVRNCSFLDLGFALDQDTDETFSIEPGGDLYDAFVRLLDRARIYNRFVDPTIGARVWEAAAWQSGTSAKRIADRLAQLAGTLPPYINNEGVCIVRANPELRATTPDHVYTLEGGRLISAPAPVENDNYLDAPNLHIVKGTGPTGGPVIGRASIDPRLDWSVEQRGIPVTEVHTLQGLDGDEAAQRAAEQFAAADYRAHWEAEIVGFPDPRHDVYQIVEYRGVNWREAGWTLGLDPGDRTHKHTLVRDEWEYQDQ